MDADVIVVHGIWALMAFFIIVSNLYFLYVSSSERNESHILISGHLTCDFVLGIFVIFTSAQWLVMGIPESGVRCDILSMIELMLVLLPVVILVGVAYSRKRRLIDLDSLTISKASNYVMLYFAFTILVCVIVIELVGAKPTKFGCTPNWDDATWPVVFLVIGCLCLLWVFLTYLRIYSVAATYGRSKIQQQTQWSIKQERITTITLLVAVISALCYSPNIPAAVLLYLEIEIPWWLRVLQFTGRLLLGCVDPFLFGLGIPSIRNHSMWGVPDDGQKGLPAMLIDQRQDDSDDCYFPVAGVSSREPEHISRSSESAKERLSIDRSSEASTSRTIHRPHTDLEIPYDEGRSDIIWSGGQ